MVELPGWQDCQTWGIEMSETRSFQVHFLLKYEDECLLSRANEVVQDEAGCFFEAGSLYVAHSFGKPKLT